MNRKTPPAKEVRPDRADRLKSALKANLARRKAQARARQEDKTARGEQKEKP